MLIGSKMPEMYFSVLASNVVKNGCETGWLAGVSDEVGTALYRFEVYKEGNTVPVAVQDYSTNNKMEFIATTSGTYYAIVYAKDDSGKVIQEKFDSVYLEPDHECYAYCYAPGKCAKCGKAYDGDNITHSDEYFYITRDATWHEVCCMDCGEYHSSEKHSFKDGECICGLEYCEHSKRDYFYYDCDYTPIDRTIHMNECMEEITCVSCGILIECSEVVVYEEHTFENGVCVCGYENMMLQISGLGILTVKKTTTLSVKDVSGNTLKNKNLDWSSDDKSIATVSSRGVVTAKKVGTVTITAEANDGTIGIFEIEVVPAVKKVVLSFDGEELKNGATVTMNRGDTAILSAEVTPEGADPTITWKSSNPKTVSVDEDGCVEALKKNTKGITITAKTSNGKTATVKIKVVDPYEPTGVTLEESGTLTLKMYDTLQLHANVKPDTADRDLTWSSSREKYATVDENGLVTPIKPGKTVTITVKTYNGKTDSVNVKIVDAPKPKEDFKYSINNGKCTITGYNGTAINIVIPEKLQGYPVTAIGDYAFYENETLQSITIPYGVTSIGEYAFIGCHNLVNVSIPESVTSIEYRAFRECTSLKSVVLPESLTNLAGNVFYDCSSLESINIPSKITTINDWTFTHCDKLKSITIPDGVTSIGACAFCNCDILDNVVIPDSVTSIGDKAFLYCYGLKNITIPSSVKSIGEDVFKDCHSSLAINGEAGSEAESYASRNNIQFKAAQGSTAEIISVKLSCNDAPPQVGKYFTLTVVTNGKTQKLLAVNNTGTGFKNPDAWTTSQNADGTITWTRSYIAEDAITGRYWIVTPYNANDVAGTAMNSNKVDIAASEYRVWYMLNEKRDEGKFVIDGTIQLTSENIGDKISIYLSNEDGTQKWHPSDNNNTSRFYYEVKGDEGVLSLLPHAYQGDISKVGEVTVEIWDAKSNLQIVSIRITVVETHSEYFNILRNTPKGENPLDNEKLFEILVNELIESGFTKEKSAYFVQVVKDAPELYRDLYLYSFFNYRKQQGSSAYYSASANTLYISGYDAGSTFFHESGHALDYNGGLDFIPVTVSDHNWKLYLTLEEEIVNLINIYIDEALYEGGLILSQEDRFDIIYTMLGLNKGYYTINEEENWELVLIQQLDQTETKVLERACVLITATILNKNLYNYSISDLRNSYMIIDMLSAYVGNSMFTNKLMNDVGHSEDYWRSEEGTPNLYHNMEAWAEFFSAQMVQHKDALEKNYLYFPNACKEMEQIAKQMLEYYKEKAEK